ncbi:hypothetical protein [Paenibacillus hexagrammi]|uniref:Uncharacterized protein n=1 Tax=Paenibacillus hexagrammi TaxID=2908839 RepID=A0ABY3SIQ0_9BACL|nr:hypothetical protein [Paenibacillus sp. YPD9-1]UJF33395.1 hypothetical protein L0M14_28460 [Paenibacillus sp. YPD9-1]
MKWKGAERLYESLEVSLAGVILQGFFDYGKGMLDSLASDMKIVAGGSHRCGVLTIDGVDPMPTDCVNVAILYAVIIEGVIQEHMLSIFEQQKKTLKRQLQLVNIGVRGKWYL